MKHHFTISQEYFYKKNYQNQTTFDQAMADDTVVVFWFTYIHTYIK